MGASAQSFDMAVFPVGYGFSLSGLAQMAVGVKPALQIHIQRFVRHTTRCASGQFRTTAEPAVPPASVWPHAKRGTRPARAPYNPAIRQYIKLNLQLLISPLFRHVTTPIPG
jgi:hypothetical protein